MLCRYQARELWLGLKHPLERMGVDMVCLVHEWIDREVGPEQGFGLSGMFQLESKLG